VKQILFALLLALAVTLPALSAADMKETPINASSMLLPGSLSASQDFNIVVAGMYPNTCYTWGRADVTQPQPFYYEVRLVADLQQGRMCAMHLVPFQQSIDLGQLQSGKNVVRLINADGTYIEESTNVN